MKNCSVTGLYYYGARYYDPRISVWLSSDPLQEKYPNISSYAYANLNPIKFIDPDGKDGIVTINGNNIVVSCVIYIYGKDATNAAVSSMKSIIDNHWAKQSSGANWTYTDPSTGTVFDVQFDVTVKLYGDKEGSTPLIIPGAWNPTNTNNYIKVENGHARDYVRGGDEGVWDPSDLWTSAHEFGHLIGLKDRYKDNSSGRSIADTGWSGNIMGTHSGTVDQRNIDGILSKIVEKFNKEKNKALETNIKRQQQREQKTMIRPADVPVPGVDKEFRYVIDNQKNEN